MKEPPNESMKSERLREEFNRWAAAGKGESMELEHLPIVLPVLDRMAIEPDDNILDIGCGAGWLVNLLAEQVPEGRVIGIDVSDEMIARARQRYVDTENAMFVIGTAEEIPWDANFFSKALSVESAYYWSDPARGLREIFRVLCEGGTAWVAINYYRDNAHSHQWSEVFQTPAHLLAAAEWAQLFENAGFENVAHLRVPDPTPVPEVYSGRWFRDAAQLRDFRREGALVIHGRKPKP